MTRSSNEAVSLNRSTKIIGSPPSITDSGRASILHCVVTIHLDGVLPTRCGSNEHGAAFTAVSSQCSDFEDANRSRASRIASTAACESDRWRTKYDLSWVTVNPCLPAVSISLPCGDERLPSPGTRGKAATAKPRVRVLRVHGFVRRSIRRVVGFQSSEVERARMLCVPGILGTLRTQELRFSGIRADQSIFPRCWKALRYLTT